MSTTSDTREKASAPQPDDSRKPDSPTEVTKPSWKYVLGKTAREFGTDQCTDIAASLTYYAVLAIFPALIALVSLLGVFGQSANSLLTILSDVAPASAVEVLRGPIEQFSNSPTAGFALVSGIVLAVWSASGYVGAFTRAMNRVYEVEEGRTFLKLKPMQLLVTVIGIGLILVMVILLAISGSVTDAVGDLLGAGEAVKLVWSIAKWPVIAFILVLMIAVLYYATPNAQQPKFRWMSLGALVALVVLALASLGFAFYVATFANYDRTYGSLGGVVVFLLWLWIANIALLFGAEFDAELERGRQLQAGIEAEQILQLPPRDTTKSDKAAEQERKDIETGREIRLSRGESDGKGTTAGSRSRSAGSDRSPRPPSEWEKASGDRRAARRTRIAARKRDDGVASQRG